MRCASCVAVLLAVPMIAGGGPRIDGLFQDWAGVPVLAVDPVGDNTDTSDVTLIRAQSLGTELFLMMDLGATLNVQSGPTATEIPLVHIELPSDDVLTIDLRTRKSYLNDVGNTIGLDVTRVTTGPTYAHSSTEIRVELGGLGVQLGDTVSIALSGSDDLAPVAFTMDTPGEEPTRRSSGRTKDTAFRVAAYNTEQNGIQDVNRRQQVYRQVQAVRADVYCFEEEWNLSATSIATAMGQADPHNDGAAWNVHKISGTHVASRSTVIPISSFNSRYSAAVVDLPGGAIAVLAIHPKCCGHIGSGEDAQRIAQTQDMIQTLDALRASHFGVQYRTAPIVIIGDWNLVGSRTPLTMLENAVDHGLRDWILPQLIGEEAFTWLGHRTGAGSFTPGRLDLCMYSADRLVRRNGFVLDSREMNAKELAAHGLEQDDSQASDHMMIVADFAFSDGLPGGCPGDIDADARVGVSDLSLVIEHLGLQGGPADVNSDATVDVNDLAFVIFRLGDACE
jgi:hypothetical protein